MASNKFMTAFLAVSATVSVAAFAGCTPPTTPPTGQSPAPGTQSPAPTQSPGTTPTPAPGGTDTTATPTPTPVPSTPDTSAKATVHGVVYDEQAQRLSGVTVTGKVLGGGLFANGSDELTTSSQVGSFALNGAPTGETILITVSKDGFTTRQQTIVPLANLQGDPSANKVDFGNATVGEDTFSMTDMPEVTSMTPSPDSTGVDPATTFTLTWSEPVNTADVENEIAIGIASGGATSKYTLSSTGVTLGKDNQMFNASLDEFNSTGAAGGGTALIAAADVLYDTAHFTFAWSNNNQTVTATFRPGFKLPSDKDSSKIPQYAVGFKAAIRDAAGTGRSDKFFRVSPAQLGKNGYKFVVAADTTAPKLVGITALNAPAAQGGTADVVRFQFSETMVLFPNTGAMNAGVRIPTAANTAADVLAVTNYNVEDEAGIGAAPTALADINEYTGAGGTVGLYSADPTQSTTEVNTALDTFAAGVKVWGGIDTTVQDPAGNAIETSNNTNLKSATSL